MVIYEYMATEYIYPLLDHRIAEGFHSRVLVNKVGTPCAKPTTYSALITKKWRTANAHFLQATASPQWGKLSGTKERIAEIMCTAP